MDYAFRQSESEADRSVQFFLADKADQMTKYQAAQAESSADKAAKGYIFSKLLGF